MSKAKQYWLPLFLVAAVLLFPRLGRAQVLISYPSPAQNLTKGLDSTLLTVKVAFTTPCTGSAVNLHFPTGINYIPGSLVKTAGSPVIDISEGNISNLNAPVFDFSGVSSAGDITFTVQRRALCSASDNGKDTVIVNGSCGAFSESNGSVNSYSILSPVLTMSNPASLSNMQNYATFSRTVTITNGGNGCLDTLFFYIIYPQSGIAFQSLMANGQSVSSYMSSGDTAFFKISGTALSADGLLCNGENLTLTEEGKVLKCNTITQYGATYAGAHSGCAITTASGNMTMSGISQNLTADMLPVQPLGTCTPGVYDVVFTSNGTGTGAAGTLFNFTARFAVDANTNSLVLVVDSTNNITIPVVYTTGGINNLVNTNQFSTDPDGPGTGLDDIDGDGQFDDLPSGQQVRLRVSLTWPCPAYPNISSAAYGYFTDMCGNTGIQDGINVLTSNPVLSFSSGSTTSNPTYPGAINSGVPFTVSVSQSNVSGGFISPPGGSNDSTYFRMLIPEGVSLSGSGNITRNGIAVPANRVRLIAGSSPGDPDTLFIITPGGPHLGNYSVDVVYNGPPASLAFSSSAYYIDDPSCNCPLTMFSWSPFFINAFDQGGMFCTDGIANSVPVIRRQTLGYTDRTLTTRVAPGAVTGLAAITMLERDSMTIIQGGLNHAASSNLFYSYEIPKAGAQNVLAFAHGKLYIRNHITGVVDSCVMPQPADQSDATVQKMVWDLSACLPGGNLDDGDSTWVNAWYRVEHAYNTSRTPANNTESGFYKQSTAPAPNDTFITCSLIPSNFYVVRYSRNTFSFYPQVSNSCAQLSIGNSGAFRAGITETEDIFPDEIRPPYILDSFAYIMPQGYIADNSFSTVTYTANGAPTVQVPYTLTGNRISVYNSAIGTPGFLQPNDLRNLGAFGNLAISQIRVLPTCAAPLTGTAGTFIYYLRSYAYSDNPGTEQMSNTYALSWPLANRPLLNLNNNTGNVQGVLAQHSWDLQLNNTGSGPSAFTWLALEKGDVNTAIVVDSVNYLDTSNTVGNTLPVHSYATGTWYEVTSTGIEAGSGSQKLRVFFHYSRCTADSLVAKTGWNCTSYPSPVANPAMTTCTLATATLRVNPQASQLQINITDQPTQPSVPMCSTDSTIVKINSAQAANVLNPKVLVTLPSGLTAVMPFEVEYPSGSGIWANVTPTQLSGNIYELDIASQTVVGSAGIPGTSVNPGAAGRALQVKVKYTSSCDFSSGSRIKFDVYGDRPCGQPASGDGSFVRTDPINITGATAVGGAGMSMTTSGTSLSCGSNAVVDATVTPVGSPSSIGDTAIYELPAALAYDGTFTPGSNCSSCVMMVSQVGGSTVLKVALPPGVPANTPISFSYGVEQNVAGCGSDSIACTVKRQIPALTCGAMVCTNSSTVIGSGYSQPIMVTKPDLSLSAAEYISGTWGAGNTISMAFSYANSGTESAPANTYQAELYCGTSTTPFAVHTLAKTVDIGETERDTFMVTLPSSSACNDLTNLTVKLSPEMNNSTMQCLCSESVAQFNVALPVTLVSFDGVSDGCVAALNWETASEFNSLSYEVEYSQDGYYYQSVGKVMSANSADGHHYTYRYPMVGDGLHLFRLKSVDIDGKYTYSPLVRLWSDCGSVVTVVPNPVDDVFRAYGLSAGDHIRVLSADGRVLIEREAKAAIETVSLKEYPSGLYMLHVQKTGGGNASVSIKINKR